MNSFENLNGRVWEGTVVKKPSETTVAVMITRVVKHKIYGLRFKRNKTFQVHDPIGVKVGDTVTIQECPPISKMKTKVVIGRKL